MQRIALLLLFICNASGVFSQSISQLEQQLESLSGVEYTQVAVELSKKYYAARKFDEAALVAERGARVARNDGSQEWEARALYNQGRAQLRRDGSAGSKKRAATMFWDAYQLTENMDLKLASLTAMNGVGVSNLGKERRQQIQSIIAELKRQMKARNSNNNTATASNNEPAETNTSSPNTNAPSRPRPSTPWPSTSSPGPVKAEVSSAERLKLMEQLETQAALIDSLSEDQIKNLLMVTQQKSLLDSLAYTKMVDSLRLAQQETIVEQQETAIKEQLAQIELQESQRNLLILAIVLVIIIALFIFLRSSSIRRYNKIIKAERDISDELLLNILPASVAEELKRDGAAVARQYDQVSVLFSDFKGFSKIASSLSPADLVEDLDECFKGFDEIVQKAGVEKIKTIGDAYMCASGLPEEDEKHAEKLVQVAIDMQKFLDRWNIRRQALGKPKFEARIGIHTGPIVAGVVGSKKFAYDIWGDTVNVAARMESAGEANRVNVSSSTYVHIKDKYVCRYRGRIPAKNIGEIEMYFVEPAQ